MTQYAYFWEYVRSKNEYSCLEAESESEVMEYLSNKMMEDGEHGPSDFDIVLLKINLDDGEVREISRSEVTLWPDSQYPDYYPRGYPFNCDWKSKL